MLHKNSKLTKEQHNQIIDEFKATNPSTSKLAIKYNVSIRTIRRLLNKHSVEFVLKYHGSFKFSEKDRLEIIKLYLSGLSSTDISKIFKCHRSTISRYLRIENGQT